MNGLTIVFDLDGTLVDTAPDLVDTLNAILRRQGLLPVPYDVARPLIGGGAKELLKRGLAAEGLACGPAEVDRLYAQFIAHYTDHIADRSRPFPGLEGALDHLAAKGCRFAVCTNKLEQLALLLLDKLGLIARFAAICGQDTFGVQKPDAEIFRLTARAAGGRPDRAIMVGDSFTDVRTARAAGAPIIAVDFGYTQEPVASFAPDRIIGHFDALPRAVHELAAELA